jgi:hypothetical protein
MKRGLLPALKLVVAISLLAFVLFLVPLPDIFKVLGSADRLLIALSFSLIVLDQYLGAIQMRPLASTLNLSVTANEILRINMISTFYQLFLAGSLSGGVPTAGIPAPSLASSSVDSWKTPRCWSRD